MEYFIWCDESVKKGQYFSNFYGGVLVKSKDLKYVQKKLTEVRVAQGLLNEIKWQKVTEHYVDKYINAIDVFFDLMEQGKVKMRVMFTQNSNKPLNLSNQHLEDEYFILYYQFFKHAFGLINSNDNESGKPVYIRAYFDTLPDKIEKNNRFKEFIKGLEREQNFQLSKIKFRKDAIAEVRSHEHVLLQFMDVVLGAMAFRLNDLHKEIPEGKKRRGKRTKAKEKLYKHILTRIRKIHKGFNIGKSTGKKVGMESLWLDAYRHWNFIPKEHEVDNTLHKQKK
ncbi:DUF3800 domain-containing protein [Arcicella sp. DC2W]|uniref:DUF3800 domain-containing protein n=1 Tax=Arcicella gelida TaxID=2984195 RepID=A0ABU5S9E5_9BACT|nr:DUF3800 domain-containing protein [Arcicella sp. DC2W]MEA5405091.1 DUF3800 domain-containing protein [Arcicella sp. DC2W]